MNRRSSTEKAVTAALCLMILASSAFRAEAADDKILLPSQVNADPQLYDGQEVVVRGYLFFGPEQNFLLDSRERGVINRRSFHLGIPSTPEDDRYCLTIINSGILLKNDKDHWRLNKHTLTLKGKFFAHYGDKVVDLGACPIRSGFTIEKIIRITE